MKIKGIALAALGAIVTSCGALKPEKKAAFLDNMSSKTEAAGLKVVDTISAPHSVTGEKMATVIAVDSAGDYHKVYFSQRFNGVFRAWNEKIPEYDIAASACGVPLAGEQKAAFNAAASAAFAKKNYTVEKTLGEPVATKCQQEGVYLLKDQKDGLYHVGSYEVSKKGKATVETSKYPVNPARY